MPKEYKFIIKKSKVIDIFDNNYVNLTCIIFINYSLINKNLNNNKLKILNLVLYYNKFLFTINESLTKNNVNDIVSKMIDIDNVNIDLIYNRHNIKLFLVKINKPLINKNMCLSPNNKIFLYKYTDNIYDLYNEMLKIHFNSHLNEYIYTNFFRIKYKSLIKLIILN